MTPEPHEMAAQADALSTEFALLCATRKECNEAAANELDRVMLELIEAARAYRTSVVPGGEECNFGLLAHAINELEIIVHSAD